MKQKTSLKTFSLSQGLYRVSAVEEAVGGSLDSSIILLPLSSEGAAALFLSPTREYVRLVASSTPVVLQVLRENVEFQAFSLCGEGEPLGIKVDSVSFSAPEKRAEIAKIQPPSPAVDRLLMHVSGLGDVEVEAADGLAALPGKTAVEGFNLLLGEPFAARFALEYKGLAASGAETPWVRGGQYCGTRGHRMPLTGLAFRVSASSPELCDCEYQVRFLSGQFSRVVRNGVPVRSPQPSDPIVAIRLVVIPHAAPAAGPSNPAPALDVALAAALPVQHSKVDVVKKTPAPPVDDPVKPGKTKAKTPAAGKTPPPAPAKPATKAAGKPGARPAAAATTRKRR